MSLEDLLSEFNSLSAEDQKKIKTIIANDYVAKANVVELQNELNDLSRENSQIRQEISKKFAKKEHQTISFQLGKSVISTLKGERKIRDLPFWGMELFVESLQRKETDQLTTLEKSLYPLVEYKDSFSAKNYKEISVAVLKSLVNKLENKNSDEKPSFEGEFEEIKLIGKEPAQLDLKVESETAVKQVFKVKEMVKSVAKSDRLRIACIMDEFTFFCFSPEADLLQLTPENWVNEVSEFQPDLLFVESAWQGKESLWKAKVSQNDSVVQQLIKFCKMNAIKTMFWNKEDPVHFGTFIDVAKQVDVVFTTDIDCIGKYKSEVGHDDVYLMPFAAQPKTHNPIEIYDRKDAFNFAGSFYLKYPERQRDFVNLTEVAIEAKSLDIYDRNFNNPHPHYEFPDQFKPYILGRLEPHEIDKAYKGYVYGINMNTIKQSQSMFARRVFEMIASNTIVLSNYSRGVRNFFGDLVLCSDNKNELQRKLELITQDNDVRDAFKLLGLRKVLSEHTYEDRMQYILSKLKINYNLDKYQVAVVAKVETVKEFNKVVAMFNDQNYVDKSLVILNPLQLQLESSDQIQVFVKQNELLEYLQNAPMNYVAYFSVQDLYLENYLTDMLLSFKYLKDQECNVVTKDSFYINESGKVNLSQGVEYNFVDQVMLKASVFEADNLEFIDQFFADDTTILEVEAFSIDRFNYVSDCDELNEKDASKILAKVQLDEGVDLKGNLLPYAESIRPAASAADQGIEIGLEALKDNIVSDHKLIEIQHKADRCIVQSKLAKTQHRYISLLKAQKVLSDQIEVNIAVQGDLKSQLVIEFYNAAEKVAFEILETNQLSSIAVPAQANEFQLSLRVKGVGQLSLDTLRYTFKAKQQDSDVTEKNSSIVSLGAEIFSQELVKGTSNQIQFFKQADQPFIIKTTLAPAKHAYMYMKKIFTREELNLVLNSEFELKATTTAEDVRVVFEFQDEQNQKISHSMNPILGGHALAIPMNCKYVRIGLKVVGKGITEISSLDIGVVKNPIVNFIPKSDVLIIAKQYPSYSDLYKYGFLHSRVKAYKQEGRLVNMFRLTSKAEEYGFSEFEGIDVVSHNHTMLDKLLASGVYKKICIHLLDNKMWEVVEKYKDEIEIIIWIHGAEIRSWQRRAYEAESLTEAEVIRQTKLSDQRKRFWRKILLNDLTPKVNFVFVSQYFREESEQDLGIKFPDEQCHIIHNYIDENIFSYEVKPVSQRFKLLSIRPFANKTYANDMTVNAVLQLAKRPNFHKFEIAIYGDGVLFDELTAPLKKFSNVKLHKTFLTHAQIADLHKQYGVFIVPTRMDSQGVSRGEAMSSGLVPITTNVAAIPEFVDAESGIIVPAEDYKAIAEKIYDLSKNSSKFKKLSMNASSRVKAQCSYKETILKEIILVG